MIENRTFDEIQIGDECGGISEAGPFGGKVVDPAHIDLEEDAGGPLAHLAQVPGIGAMAIHLILDGPRTGASATLAVHAGSLQATAEGTLNANTGASPHGVFTKRPETLTNDFFVNLLDMRTAWTATSTDEAEFEGRDRASGALK